MDSYLQWFYETIVLLRELLSDEGSFYVHLDWHVAPYAKAALDEVFGPDNFRNELIWKRQTSKGGAFDQLGQYGRIHETVYFYSKSDEYVWNQLFTEYSEEHVNNSYKHVEAGRRYALRDLTAAGSRRGDSGKPIVIQGAVINLPNGRHWALGLAPGETVQEAVNRLVDEGRIWYEPGKMPRYKLYLDEMPGVPLQSVWTDIPPVQAQSFERLNYPTQKPEALLERIIKASSNEGDLILDCFAGSGTTAAVAEKLNRRWITCDLGRFAIHMTRKRLLAIPNVKPFVVQNLGKYERQLWQTDEFGPNAAQRIARYIRFILDLYHAQPLTGYSWLHGVKGGRVVHVGAVDSPVTSADVRSIIREWRKSLRETGATNTGIDVLGWDFAFELNETARQQAAEAGVDLHFLTIPREVLEKKAVEQGDIQFFELAALFLEHHVAGRKITLKLTNFIPPLEYVPQEVRSKITKWDAWIDYWAADWDFKGDTFHNQWQSYRTRKDKSLHTSVVYQYETAGVYQVQVKVIDILGNDTTKTIEVKVE
ncbi:MAG: DNA methyltransferase [Anaerolineae bacterium]